jgi:hypothetical protein
MQDKQKLFWLNFNAKHKALKPLLFILLLEVMIILHQAGILVMVR